jgi:hypothetical protein
VSPVRYELVLYIPEDAILHSHRRENLKSYTEFVPLYIFVDIGTIMCNGDAVDFCWVGVLH